MQNTLAQSWWDMTPFEVRDKINQRIFDIDAPKPSVWSVENRILDDATTLRIYLPNPKSSRNSFNPWWSLGC